MVTVKIECPCGQHYSFEAEPANGPLSSGVACPACGADGTAAANEILAGEVPAGFPNPSDGAPARLKIAGSESTPSPRSASAGMDGRTLGVADRSRAEIEARAKMSWGDSQTEVANYLMLQGFSAPEASGLVRVLYKERLAALRIKGIRKAVAGLGLICVPVIAYLAFAHIGVFPLKLFSIAIMVGLWGCWLVMTGLLTLAAPRMETGDVAE